MLMVAYITHKPGFTSTWERTLGLFSQAKIYAQVSDTWSTYWGRVWLYLTSVPIPL